MVRPDVIWSSHSEISPNRYSDFCIPETHYLFRNLASCIERRLAVSIQDESKMSYDAVTIAG